MTSPSASLEDIAAHLDGLLHTRDIPDYPGAMNGVQVEHAGPVTRCAVAVDASLRTIDAAIVEGATLLIVHHGLFWGGAQPLRGRAFERIRRLITSDIAVYASHLPLDLHPEVGNNALLARELGLAPSAGFAHFQGVAIGVTGNADLPTAELVARCAAVASREGGHLVAAGHATEGRRTRRWALCSGAGASSDTLREAAAAGVDTLIVGEGPHHTAVEAADAGLVIIYAGHYVTETLGIRSLAEHLEASFEISARFELFITIDGPRLVREGSVDFAFTDGQPESAERRDWQTYLTRKLGGLFQEEIIFDGLTPPAGGPGDKLKRFRVGHLESNNEWISIGYRLFASAQAAEAAVIAP